MTQQWREPIFAFESFDNPQLISESAWMHDQAKDKLVIAANIDSFVGE